uniref:DNA-directed RNA polymerase n=1 Tax=Panagrellus redivivus TaxID=6233 RepID=A0A7E4VUR6_PANRE
MNALQQPSKYSSWFSSLPYGFKARFTALLPLNILSTFTDVQPETLTLAKSKIQQVPFALSYPPSLWQSNKVFYVQQVLRLSFSSIDEYDRLTQLITGPYMDLQLRGTYSWKLVIQLIRPNVDYVNLKGDMQLPNYDYGEFIDCLIKLGTNRNRLKYAQLLFS